MSERPVMRFLIGQVLVLLLIFLTIGWLGHRSHMEGTLRHVRFAVSETPLSAPIFIAHAMGLFRKHGLNVSIVDCQGGVLCAKMLYQDLRVDYATASETVAVFNAAEHDDLRVISSFVTSSNDVKLLSLEASPVQSLSQLEGSNVGVVAGSSSEFYFDLLLIAHALQDIEINRVYLYPEQTVSALLTNQVDVVSIWEPYGFEIESASEQAIHDLGVEGLYELSFNVLSRRAQHLDLETEIALLSAIDDAIRWIEQNPVKSIHLIADRLHINPKQVEWLWEDYIFHLSNSNSLISTMQFHTRWGFERGLLKKNLVDLHSYIDSSALDHLQLNR